MDKIKIAIIDGTGDDDDGKYAKDMAKSFCKVLGDQLRQDADYRRGPSMLGKEVLAEAMGAAQWLEEQSRADPKAKLMLAGYSRGGSAAIMAAEILGRKKLEVDAVFLFDPVARHSHKGGEVIPANVRFSRVARRSQELAFVLKYEGSLKTNGWLGDTSNPCRPFFGNTGVGWLGDGDHKAAHVFKGSHGALGGVGWKFVEEDAACQAAVSKWMGEMMRSRGLVADLGPGSLDPTEPEKPWRSTKLMGQALDLGLMGQAAASRFIHGGLRSRL